VSHLIALGHRRIGFIGIDPKDARNLRRYLGYADALTKHGLPVNQDFVVGPESGPAYATQEDGYAGLVKLWQLKKPPTAIFARNDYTAIGALHGAHALGLAVPGDVAIAGFDNIPLAAFMAPPLTTVEQPIAEQGKRAAEFLLERIAGSAPAKRREVCFGSRLIIRASTDSRARTDIERRVLVEAAGVEPPRGIYRAQLVDFK